MEKKAEEEEEEEDEKKDSSPGKERCLVLPSLNHTPVFPSCKFC